MTEKSKSTLYMILFFAWAVLLTVGFAIAGEIRARHAAEKPRAYCLDADGIQGTAWISGRPQAIITLDRYVVSEGECKIETVNEEEGQ